MESLKNQYCSNSAAISKLSTAEILNYLAELPNWLIGSDQSSIIAKFEFKNFKQTMFFINAVAYIAEHECHHPEMKFGFNYCQITLNTHDVAGLSINDFICAAKINGLLGR